MKYEEPWCVRIKREGQARIYEITKNMSFEEKCEYWKKRSLELHEKFDKAKAEAAAVPVESK